MNHEAQTSEEQRKKQNWVSASQGATLTYALYLSKNYCLHTGLAIAEKEAAKLMHNANAIQGCFQPSCPSNILEWPSKRARGQLTMLSIYF